MDSIRPPALSPNVVPRSYTKLNSTYLRGFFFQEEQGFAKHFDTAWTLARGAAAAAAGGDAAAGSVYA